MHMLSNKPLTMLHTVRLVVFDFDGVFTDNSVYVMEDGREAVRCFRSDGLGLEKLRLCKISTVIISTETNQVVAARAKKLNIDCIYGCSDKLNTLEQYVLSKNIPLEQVAYVGNDINDLECLKVVGFPMVVQDAYPDVTAFACYQTKRPGGYGAVREVCDLISKSFLNWRQKGEN